MKKIKIIKKGADIKSKQNNEEKVVKESDIALKISNWIEDFHKKKIKDQESLVVFIEEESLSE